MPPDSVDFTIFSPPFLDYSVIPPIPAIWGIVVMMTNLELCIEKW